MKNNYKNMTTDELRDLAQNIKDEISERSDKLVEVVKVQCGMADYYFRKDDVSAFVVLKRHISDREKLFEMYGNHVNISIDTVWRKESDAGILLERTQNKIDDWEGSH